MKLFNKMIIGAALTTSLLGLSACGGEKDASNEAKSDELSVWTWDPNYNVSMINAAVDRYNEKENTDLKLNIQDMPSSDVNQKLQTILSSGSGKGLPDIVLLQDVDAQKFLMTYPNAFADMSDKVNTDDFYDFKQSAVEYDGKTYGVPFDTGVTGLFYRKDLFEKAGFEDKDLQNITWNEFMEIGEKVTKETGVSYYADDFYTETRLEQIMLQSANSWFNDEDGNPTIEGNPVFESALETTKQLKNSEGVKNINGWDNYLKVTNSGETASVVIGSWYMSTIMSAEDQSGLWRVAPIPSLDKIESATNYSNTGGASWYVLDNSSHKDEAINLLTETFGTDTEFQQKLLEDNNAIIAAKAAADGEAYQAEVPFFDNQKVYEDLTDWMSKVPAVHQTKETPTITDTLKENLQTILDGKTSIKEGMEEIQRSAENKIQ